MKKISNIENVMMMEIYVRVCYMCVTFSMLFPMCSPSQE